MDIEHEPVAVVGDGAQRKDLRAHLRLQIENDAHDPGAVARDAQSLDIWIFGGDLAVQLGERGGDVVRLQVEHEARRMLDTEDRVLDLFLRFEGEARVFRRGPDASGEDLRLDGAYGKRSEESQASPAPERASSLALRASPSKSSRMCRSGGASRSPTFSGHSTTQSDCALKCSRKPELSHSERSLNR